MAEFNPDNFTFEIESVSFQMVHGVLTTVRDNEEGGTLEIEFENSDDGDDEIYLLARAYAELLTKVD